MAELSDDKKIASLQAQLAELNAENEKLKASAESGSQALPVQGSFTAKVYEKGDMVNKKFGFKDGFKFIRNNQATIFSTEGVIKIANTGKIDDKTAAQYPALASLTQESAQSLLQLLVDLEYAGLKTV